MGNGYIQENRNAGILRGRLIYFSISVLSAIILSGCSRYQYITVSSHLYENDRQEYVNENDTALIKYSFSGEDLPLAITIYNKLLQPLYIDLERTTVVINNVQINSPFYREGQMSYIAPQSYVTITSNPLMENMLKIKDDSLKNIKTGGGDTKVFSFDEETTPVFLRSILALSANEDDSNPTFYDYSFWVSEVTQTIFERSPRSYNPANQFYIKKTSTFGKVLGWAGVIGVIFLGGLASSGT
jgi:hypothetical protein